MDFPFLFFYFIITQDCPVVKCFLLLLELMRLGGSAVRLTVSMSVRLERANAGDLLVIRLFDFKYFGFYQKVSSSKPTTAPTNIVVFLFCAVAR